MIPIRVNSPINPYRDHVQGKSNEPITVAALLDRATQLHGVKTDCTLEAIYDRLEGNAPRIAIIGGSPDHPAHIKDWDTMLRAAVRIWEQGGVPVLFRHPGRVRRHGAEHDGDVLLAPVAQRRGRRWSSTRWRGSSTTARS